MNYIDIMSGRSKGFKAQGLRSLLALLALLYSVAVRLRNAAYDCGLLWQFRCGIPVFCIGNLTAGGTGKTPMVVWLCRYLQDKGLKVALLSRGYKSHNSNGLNDEILLLQSALPGIGFYIGSNRRTCAAKAVTDGYQVIVMDDGYQHRKLFRNLNILMIDSLCPFGYGKILPAGLLREPLAGIKRANIAILSRADLVDNETINTICNNILQYKQLQITTTCHTPSQLFDTQNRPAQLNTLAGKKVTAFCSIGNPMGFVATLEKLGATVVGRYFFDDHSQYDNERVGIIRQLLTDAADQILVTTEKDWVKLCQHPGITELRRLFWLRIELNIISGLQDLKFLVDNTVNLD